MPRAARKRASSPVEVELEPHEQPDEVMQDAAGVLQFEEALTWRAGKPIAVGELLRRLKALHEELQPMDQGDADRNSIIPKAQELANVQLLGHKDKGVKAWTLLCIVEMFRLLAPDAPYKSSQLKQIFDLFVSTVIPALASPTDPYNQQHMNALSSLTTVKSIVLLTDIPGSEKLILDLFTNCFDVMSGNVRGGHGEQLGKNVEYHMTQMLCTLVEECVALPNGVVDIILAQFLRADPSTLAASKKGAQPSTFVLREVSPAYNMARSVCSTCADKMSRAVAQYFSNVLIDLSSPYSSAKPSKARGKKRTHDESEDELDDGMLTPPAEDDYREVEKAHRLLRELWRSSPDVIQNIVPQMEAEVGAEDVQLRTMAVQTVGDMVAGIGAAGPPPPLELDPAAYPSQSLDLPATNPHYDNVLLAPAAPHAFSSVYPNAYQGFMDRHRDKAPIVRSAWATAAGRIITTSGGGKGLDGGQETQLLRYLSDMLGDQDEKVRLAAIQAVANFDYNSIVTKLASSGGVETQGSLLCNLADRIKDPKPSVRTAAAELLGRIWGVAAGAIAEGSERIHDLFGSIPTRLFLACYINDPSINAMVTRVLFDSLLPVNYPPIKPKAANGDSQRVVDSQAADSDLDPDAIRAERILVLRRDLNEKAEKVLSGLLHQQVQKAKYMETFLTACATINGEAAGDDDEADDKASKKVFNKMVHALSGFAPDPAVATEHLKKFAKHHDRRSYQLIRFCYSPESEYRKIIKATKELTKRLDEAPSSMHPVMDTVLPLVRAVSNLVYNRSHVPAIMHFARTDEKGLGGAAHEVMKAISSLAPDVFKVHVRELCEALKKQAPTAAAPNPPTAVDELKACAGFAQRYPADMPKDRDFYKAMTAFAKYGAPPEAAKHAVSVIVASADKREMYIKDIVKYCLTDFSFGAECFLSRLAALSQLRLVASKDIEEYHDEIMAVAVQKILSEVRTTAEDSETAWTNNIDEDLCAKLWSLKILVNGLRGTKWSPDQQEAQQEVSVAASNVYKLLNTLIERDGELSKTTPTAEHHKSHLRLAAANQLLKLSCCGRAIDQQLTPRDFNRLSKVTQDPLPEVRGGFVKTLRKYLGHGKLPNRFYGLVFLYAFDPSKAIMDSTTTWIKARAALCAKSKDPAIEMTFARYLSLLAHHPDFSREADELEDFVEYIMFYLKNVATQSNLSFIYHIAQRVKNVQDAIDPEKSDDLYCISDLAQAVIGCFRDVHGWTMPVYSDKKAGLPADIFASMPSHTMAQEIADTRYIPEELAEGLEDVVKASMKTKKRKSDGSSKQAAKKAKTTSATNGKKKQLPVRKTPKPAKTPKKRKVEDIVPSSDRRKSARASNVKNYAEESDSDVEEGAKWDDDDSEADNNRAESSTPPTSDPTPAPATARQEKKPAPVKSAKKAPTRDPPQRSARNTKATKSKKERDIMDVPDDSDEELSDPPSDLEA